MRTSKLLLGSALIPLIAPLLRSQEPAPLPERDVSKRAVEVPIKHGLLDSVLPPAERGAEPAPLVQPGRVAWHRSPEAAFESARASGKPVLLFQLLGRLDDEFC